MWSPAGSPAKTFPQRVKVEDLPAHVRDFGLKCCASLAKFGLALSGRKTRRTCVLADSASSSRDLPAWGMTCGGVCWELGTSARPTAATECGYLPTPTTAGNELSPSMRKHAAHERLWTWLRDRGHLPTPTAQSYGSNRGGAGGRTGRLRPSIDTLAAGLNVLILREWAMGWPIGWTALEPLATDRFQQWLRWHTEFFQTE